jgi:putative ABC transport system permease protein
MNPALVGELAQQPQVEAVSGFRFGAALIDGQSKSIQAGEPAAIAKVMHLTMKEGALADLNASGIAVSEDVAHDHGWHVGSPVDVHFIDGTDVPVAVRAIYGQSQLLGNYVLSLDLWAQHAPESSDAIVAIKLRSGVDAKEAKAALKPIVDRIAPGASFYTKGEFAERQGEEINQMLIFISFMLLAAIIISLMGIANTLSLSINERTREIGLSRAVGMLRGQLRAMVRWEGALIALFGTVGGLVLGIIGSWAIVRSTGAAGLVFKLPVGSLIVYLVIGGLFGIVSALLPANRSSRMNVLTAITHE